MLVVSNTSPLRYLVEVNAIHALPRLYGQVMTTPQVMTELQRSHFPHVVRQWAEQPPTWLQVASPAALRFLDRLDDGEASALSLAHDRKATLILIDERAGTELSRSTGIEPVGTLGILIRAGARGYIDFATAIQTLTTKTRFRYTPELIEDARRQYQTLCRDLQAQPARPNPPKP